MSASADGPLTKGGSSKSKRSFISRLPSFRKKKVPPPPESELDVHLKSAEEDLNGIVKVRPPSQGKNRKEDDVKRRSKTSSIVASYEKRLSDMKEEENRFNGRKDKTGKAATLGHHGNSKSVHQDGVSAAKSSSRFGFGFTWQKITSFENGNTNGKKTDVANGRSNGDELNANVRHGTTGSSVRDHNLELNLPHGSPPDRESTSSVRTPESDRSSVSSNMSNSSAKVYGQPMPYRSVFSDEPRGIKRQASSSQSEGLNSSSISMSRSTSPLHDTTNTGTHQDISGKQLQLNSTFTKDNGTGNLSPDIINRTFPIEESPTCIVNRTFKLEPAEDSRITSQSSEPTVSRELPNEALQLSLKEKPISCPAAEPPRSGTVERNWRDVSGQSQGQSQVPSQPLDEVMPPVQDAVRPSANPARTVPAETTVPHSCIKSSRPDPFLSPRHRLTVGAMGSMQSSTDAYSTPTRPLELAYQLRKPHISAIKHCSESLDSCELDSLCSEDLMCDSRYLDDDMFDSRDDSSCLLSRSLSVEEAAAMHRTQHVGVVSSRGRAVSVDQAQLLATNYSLEKRVGVTRGLSPSPLALPLGRRGGRSFPAHPVPAEQCQSPVEELHSLIFSSSCRDMDRNKNGNANCSRVRSQSGGTGHPLRPPRWPTLPPDEEGAVLVDATLYRHMIQDMTSVKTMLLKLKRALQTVDNSSSPFEHSMGQLSPCSSLPTSPTSEANPIQEVIIEDLKEENAVLRKEVRSLQELVADTQQQLTELHVQTHTIKPAQCNVSTQVTSQAQCTSESTDQSIQVNLPTSVSELEKASNGTSLQGSPLKVGRSPTSSPEPSLSQLPDSMETSLPEIRQHLQGSISPPSSQGSPERVQPRKALMSKIPTSPVKEATVKLSNCPSDSQHTDTASSQASQMMPSSPSHKGTTGGTSQRAGGSKKQVSRSKLTQPTSYKSKLAGSQDSLLSEGSQPDEGSQLAEDRRGGPLKRQLPQPQQPRSTGIPQKQQSRGQQGSLELQQKGMQEINGSTEGIPKPKEIRMMPNRQLTGKASGLLPRGSSGQVQKDIQPQVENGSLLPKIPSLVPMAKGTTSATKQEQALGGRVVTTRPAVIDANSNPVPMQNGVSTKPSGLQQPQSVKRVEQSAPKAGPIPTGQFARRKQSPPGLTRDCPSRSPDRQSSEEEQATPPASPKTREQQQQQPRGSRIAMPVRGRGASKLPRGTGIPTRRVNNTER
ncbi:uncharacterized protein LOC110978182 isoform X2 [Acanthaster planci]|uniref:Uncharacterized protein LOC110978182 isoform X2 n=1 Tax=Acanthaster planci TaxID=133434 RepID=A0A8B7Y6N4_ACAPL|nr:uncharacterized protein LOC110978182 isoform X2 [Acanthaster planci]